MPIRTEQWPAGTPCWIDLAVPDVAAAKEFYGTVFGWSFLDTGPEFGHYQICQVDGRAAAAIGPLMAEGQHSAWTTYLASDDVDNTAKLITENGGTVLVEPLDIADNGRMCIALDAAGAAFGVWQAAGTIGVEVYNEPGALVWNDAASRIRMPAGSSTRTSSGIATSRWRVLRRTTPPSTSTVTRSAAWAG
jgi:uncharacterized protein